MKCNVCIRQQYTALRTYHDIRNSDYQQRFNPTCALAYLEVKAHSKASTLESITLYLFTAESSFTEYKCYGPIVRGVSSNVEIVRASYSECTTDSPLDGDSNGCVNLIEKHFRNNIKDRKLALEQIADGEQRYKIIRSRFFSQFRLALTGI